MPDRAMVAISDDRQWLVVHYKDGGFVIYTKRGFGMDEPFEVWDDEIEDTGQDAHEVLAAFLREREE